MRKTISLILIAAILAAFTACGGEAVPVVTTSSDTTETESLSAETEEVSNLPESFDLEGYEFNILRHNPTNLAWSLNEFSPAEQNGEILNDAFYERNLKVCDKYNFSIKQVEVDNNPQNVIRQSVLAGDDEYDAALIRLDQEYNVYDGTYMNLHELKYLDLDKGWWNQSVVHDMTLVGKLYFITGDIIVCENESMMMTMYNRPLADDFGIENMYETVRAGKWTLDKMYDCMKLAASDIDGNGRYDEKDRYGLLYADNAAAAPYYGATMTYLFSGADENGKPKYTANSERAYEVYEKVQKLLSDNTLSYNWSNLSTDIAPKIAAMVENKQVLFQNMVLSFVRRNFRDVTIDFGLLPIPKFDETQETYATMINIATPYLFVPASVTEPDKVGFILEALASESHEITDVYYQIAMQSKYTRDTESYEMIILAQENIVFDLGFIVNFGGLADQIRSGINNNIPYASLLASSETAAKAALDKLFDNLK